MVLMSIPSWTISHNGLGGARSLGEQGLKVFCDLPHVPESFDGTHNMLNDVIDFGGSCKATDAKP
jgi:hypothetical protein